MKNKNIFRFNDKAVAGISAIAVVSIVIIAGFGIYYLANPSSGKSYWETENEFGTWQDELIITFEDGETQSLKIIQNQIVGDVLWQGKPITNVAIRCNAVVSGSGFTGAQIKTTEFGYYTTIRDMSTQRFIYEDNNIMADTSFVVNIGENYNIFSSGVDVITNIENNPEATDLTGYRIGFDPRGTVWYRGYPDDGSQYVQATLPPSRVADVILMKDSTTGSITVTLSSDACGQ